MRIEVLSEDKSGIPVLDKIIGQVLSERGSLDKFELYLHAHRGMGFLPEDLNSPPHPTKTGLYDLLPAKLRAYESLADSHRMVLVAVHDSDDNDPGFYYRQLEFLFRTFAPSHLFVIGISVEELESWILGDFEAIQAAYPNADFQMWEKYKQDSVCGTWEHLAKVLEGKKRAKEIIKLGYPVVGIYKCDWARRIAPHMDIHKNASPSLAKFVDRLHMVLSMAEKDLAEVKSDDHSRAEIPIRGQKLIKSKKGIG